MDPSDKANYRLVSILPLVSKVFEKIMYDQLYKYIVHFLNQLLCGFRKAHSTQHALFRLLQKWQKELDSGGFIGTILMDISDICNFAEGNALYSCGKSLTDIKENLISDTKSILNWFRLNSLKANAGKF